MKSISNQVKKLDNYISRYVSRLFDFEYSIKPTGVRLYYEMVNSDNEKDLLEKTNKFLKYINQFPVRRVNVSSAIKIPGEKMLSDLEKLMLSY